MDQSRDFATSALASAIHNTGHCHVRRDWSACLLPAAELQTTGATAAVPNVRLDHLRGADSQRVDGTKAAGKSALGLHFPIFASSQFVEEFRRTVEARDIDRLIAG
jgi:hypothetical protein